jgi:hypothetical protein
VWERYDQRGGQVDVLEHVECDGKEAAIQAADLLKKHAAHFSETVTGDRVAAAG